VTLHYLVKEKQVAAERLLRTQTTFSQPVMVSVGVLKLGVTDLIFVDPGAKVNGAYYHDVLLSQQLLPIMRDVSAASSSSFNTAQLLELATPAFIPLDLWPLNSHDLNPVDYKI